jgi:hypothetical protein
VGSELIYAKHDYDIVTGYGMDVREIMVCVKNSSGAHLATYSPGIEGFGRGVDHSPHLVLRLRMTGAISLLPNTPSRREQTILPY